jgi:hypothetical protein
VSGANVTYGLCAEYNSTATGVTAADYVVFKGPTNVGWTPTVVSTGVNTIRVRMCNVTGAAANPNGFTIAFIAFR